MPSHHAEKKLIVRGYFDHRRATHSDTMPHLDGEGELHPEGAAYRSDPRFDAQ